MEHPNATYSTSASRECKAPVPPSSPSALTDADLNGTVIPWEYVEKALHRKSTVLELASNCFLRILFIVAFAFFFFPFTDATARFTVFGSVAYPFLYGEISKFKESFFFRDVSTPSQYSDFVMDVVLPALADYKVPIGPNLPLGAMRLRTQRVLPGSCKLYSSVVSPGVDQRYQTCYGPLSRKFEDVGVQDSLYNREQSWQYASCATLGGASLSGHLGTYHCGGYYFDVPLWQPFANASDPESCTFESCASDPELLYIFSNPEYIKTSLSDLQSVYVGPRLSGGTPFIDDVATRLVVTELALYNPTLHLFILVKMFAEAGAGGSWKTSTDFRFLSVWDETFHGYNGYAVFFFVYLFLNVVWFVLQQGRKIHRDGLMATLLKLWTFVDIAIYALLVVSCSLRFDLYARTRAARVRLADITYQTSYPTQLDTLARRQTAGLYINGVVTILLFVSLLPYLGMEQRVRRVINSFLHYKNAIIGLILVSLVLLTAFALSGQQLLSSQLWDFRSVDSSFRTLFFIQLRQIDLNDVASAPGNRVEKIFFVYASVLLCLYTVLGAFSGVARQAFEETVKEESTTEPLWWVWRHFCAIITSPRSWVQHLIDFFRGHSEANRLHEASLILQRYRKAKYAVVLHVREKRGHYVTHQDWQLAFVDALGAISGALHSNAQHHHPRDASASSPSGPTGGPAAPLPPPHASQLDRGRKGGRPAPLPTTETVKSAPFSVFFDEEDATNTTTSHLSLLNLQLSASQERTVREHLHWVEQTWRDLVFQYLRTQDVSTTAERTKKEIEWMTCGVQDVVGEHLDLLAQFPARLASLERQIIVLSNELVPVSLTSKVLANNNSHRMDNDDDDDENNGSPVTQHRDPTATATPTAAT